MKHHKTESSCLPAAYASKPLLLNCGSERIVGHATEKGICSFLQLAWSPVNNFDWVVNFSNTEDNVHLPKIRFNFFFKVCIAELWFTWTLTFCAAHFPVLLFHNLWCEQASFLQLSSNTAPIKLNCVFGQKGWVSVCWMQNVWGLKCSLFLQGIFTSENFSLLTEVAF